METYSVLRPVLKKRDPQDILDSQDDGRSQTPQRHLAADQRMGAVEMFWTAVARLVTWLSQSALGSCLNLRVTSLWQSDAATWLQGLPCYATLLLQGALWLLLGWFFSDLYLGLPCFLLALIYWLFNGPVRRAVSQAWGCWRELFSAGSPGVSEGE
ncbi:uncharacterized protein LOC143493586 [Brachyhypopomus gauderio]|uniref:uncharacterized protein LOC143493586 n=1 Tax=Brachyhypopomus gauderio TaxID=698409 RepID=UPI004042468F